MPLTNRYHYRNDKGQRISASQGRILERRKLVARLYESMKDQYANFTALYEDIAEKVTRKGYPCGKQTVFADLKQMGLANTTPQSRMSNNIRKEE